MSKVKLAPRRLHKTYRDDYGHTFAHEEAPSLPWEPLRFNRMIGNARDGAAMEEWVNDRYACSVRRYASGFPINDSPYLVIGLTHISEKSIHDFRDMQRIKNDIAGEEWCGVELYPEESRLVDPSNRFYMWVVPKGVIAWGFSHGERRVLTMKESIAPQRPFPEEGS